MRKQPHYWTDELVHQELIQICGGTGSFPSNSELQELGRSDLSNQICKRGGFVSWAERLGFKRKPSDSDFGWEGEIEAQQILRENGFSAERTDRLRAPYDLLVNGIVRIDVKSANFASYGISSGWFYRVAKHAQADILMLLQRDTKAAFCIPWYLCPTTNITISKDGGMYVKFKNNFELLRSLVGYRSEEKERFEKLKLDRRYFNHK